MGYKYSIIVPIYGVEQYIRQCIDSIIQQTYSNIEIILVDDGSKDSCPRICDEYAQKDKRIVVIHKKNGGLVSARKAGAEKATGDYVCCVDGDDYIDTNYIEEIDKVNSNNKKFDIICCGYHNTMPKKIVDSKMNVKAGEYDRKRLEQEIFPKLILSSQGKNMLPTVWAKSIKRELYLKFQMQVPDEISMGEDGACTIPCIANANSMFVIEKSLYYYRFNPTSMTKTKKPLDWNGQLKIAQHLKNVLDFSKYDFRSQFYRKVEKGFFSVAKSQFNKKEKYSDVKKEILEKYKIEIFYVAIENATFSSIKMKCVDFVIKRKLVLFFKMINYIT